MSNSIGVSGHYSLSVLRKGQVIHQTEFRNLITDNFFSRWANGSTGSNVYFFVGTGSTPPLVSDSSLQNLVGTGSNDPNSTELNNTKEGDKYYCSRVFRGSWPIGAIIGNISEIGVLFSNIFYGGAAPTNLPIDSRSLIKDPQGNPTTISLTAIDQLIVSYTLKAEIPVQQKVKVINFQGVSTTCTLESLGVLNNTRWNIPNLLGRFAPSSIVKYSGTLELYNNPENLGSVGNDTSASFAVGKINNNTIRWTVTLPSTQFNGFPSGIKYLTLSNSNNQTFIRQGLHFYPPVLKDNTKTLVLVFEYSLGRLP